MNKKWSSISIGAALLAASALLSRFLGVVRDLVIASIFGVNLDAYFAAFKVPDIIYTFLVAGAMSAAFIPIYTKLKKKSKEEASLFGSHVIHGMLTALLIGSALMWLLAPVFVPWITPGFTEALQAQTVSLTRIMLISPIFLGLSSVFQGIENSHKTFLGIALAPLVYNLSLICGAWFWGESHGVNALAWSVVAGSVLHFMVQWPSVLMTSFSYKWNWNLKTKAMKDFIVLTLPRLFGIGLTQVNMLVDTLLASLLAVGSLSVYNYAYNMQSLPNGVVAVSVSIAVFSTLAQQDEGSKAFRETLLKSLHAILFWVLPAIVGLFLLRSEMVELILQRGAFDAEAAASTSMMLGIFIWAALGQSVVPLFARAFYALHDTKTPVVIAFFSVGIQVALSFVLIQIYHLPVWALAVSAIVGATLNAALLALFINPRVKASFTDYFGIKQLAVLVNVGIMAVLVLLLQKLNYPNLLVEVASISSLGGLSYLLLSKFSRTIPRSL
jgi:putative peptidoglycan lipid II flippase